MKLELKKIKISKSQSQETIAFTGELWVSGEKAALLENAGRGGANRIYPFPANDENKLKLVREANAYCKTLPPVEYGEGVAVNLPMDLEFWISLEVGNIQTQQQIEKDTKKGIVIGNPKELETYRILKLPGNIEKILKLPNGAEQLKNIIKKIKLNPGEEILNKNLPEGLLK